VLEYPNVQTKIQLCKLFSIEMMLYAP